MVMVATLNGKITHGTDPHIYTWTSLEDQKLFFSQLKDASVIVMGSKTYEVIRGKIKHKAGTLRIVMTHNPAKHAQDTRDGQLEFSLETPLELLTRLDQKGFDEMLLVGGGEINALFLKAGLVDEIHITIEPLLFGKGKSLLAEGDLEVSLQLLDSEQLNDTGTLLLKYAVLPKQKAD